WTDARRERRGARVHRAYARTGEGRKEHGAFRGDRMTALAPVSARRRRTDQAARAVLAAGTVLAVIPLALILYYIVKKGIGAWSVHFFTSDPSGRFFGDAGGI